MQNLISDLYNKINHTFKDQVIKTIYPLDQKVNVKELPNMLASSDIIKDYLHGGVFTSKENRVLTRLNKNYTSFISKQEGGVDFHPVNEDGSYITIEIVDDVIEATISFCKKVD